MRIGILGGTFNPIHNGHINIALNIREFLRLDRVFFMLNKIPPHKNNEEILSEENRLHMLNLALKDYVYFDVEKFELEKNGISYTYESLEYLREIYRGSKLFFIIGSDSFMDFHKWKEIEKIFNSSNIVVYLRKESHRENIIKLKEKYEKLYNGKIYLYFGDIIMISSTEIRKRVLGGEKINHLVPNNVEEYILLNNLYLEEKNGLWKNQRVFKRES